MSLLVTPEEGPFVFGAYASHVLKTEPIAVPALPEAGATVTEEDPDDGEIGVIAC